MKMIILFGLAILHSFNSRKDYSNNVESHAQNLTSYRTRKICTTYPGGKHCNIETTIKVNPKIN